MRFVIDVNGASPKELREMSRTFIAFASSRGGKLWVASFFRLADELSAAAERAAREPKP